MDWLITALEVALGGLLVVTTHTCDLD